MIIVIDDFDKGRYGTLFISVSAGSDRLDNVTVPNRVRGAGSWWWEQVSVSRVLQQVGAKGP